MKLAGDQGNNMNNNSYEDADKQYVLKVYKNKDLKSFRKEIAVFNSIKKLKEDRYKLLQGHIQNGNIDPS